MSTEYPILQDNFMHRNLYLMSAGAYGGAHAYVWADSLESAFEEFVEYLDDHAPGLLVSHAEMRDLLDESAREHGFADWAAVNGSEDAENVYTDAEAGLTIIGHISLTHGCAITSHEWGGGEVDLGSDEGKAVLARTLASVLEADIEDLVLTLTDIRDGLEDDSETDVRLAVERDGRWEVLEGGVSFDTRHAPYCGVGRVASEGLDCELAELARYLVAQVIDQITE
jgi:hypothetical protein